jgi:hypothetical protein
MDAVKKLFTLVLVACLFSAVSIGCAAKTTSGPKPTPASGTGGGAAQPSAPAAK